ncbi:unnamed protein product [Ambrosiozyma monospora]|uniref:Unnamed protein product n=1 Tax=Ambrosiozyma monospora TaxID=43982 RepID=A0A9W6Z090_AMBMO|nr:unnamed protein product [Ambrosiozyma monospora]
MTSLPPETDLVCNIQHSFTSSPLQASSFNSTSKALYENFRNSNDHILDECIITDRIWKLIRQGTTHRLNSKHSPLQISQQKIMGRIRPPQHYIKINIYL